jgi:hypothetical protein
MLPIHISDFEIRISDFRTPQKKKTGDSRRNCGAAVSAAGGWGATDWR